MPHKAWRLDGLEPYKLPKLHMLGCAFPYVHMYIYIYCIYIYIKSDKGG
jgi:hypothetical protein